MTRPAEALLRKLTDFCERNHIEIETIGERYVSLWADLNDLESVIDHENERQDEIYMRSQSLELAAAYEKYRILLLLLKDF